MATTRNHMDVIQLAAIGIQRRARLRSRPGAKGIILVLLALVLTACVPIAPMGQSPAVSATTDKLPATTDVAAPEVNAARSRVESLIDNFHKADLFSGATLIAQDGRSF